MLDSDQFTETNFKIVEIEFVIDKLSALQGFQLSEGIRRETATTFDAVPINEHTTDLDFL